MATPTKLMSIWAVVVMCGAVFAVPASRGMGAETPSSPALPAPPPTPRLPEPPGIPPPLTPNSSPLALVAKMPGAIGAAEMDPNGTIHLHLREPTRSAPSQSILPEAPWSPPQERLGYGEIELNRGDLHYSDVLSHLGNLVPGQVKPVLQWRAGEQWHCAIDPARGPCPLLHLLPGYAAVR